MNQRPDISVIVPCYNAQRFLSVCLESLKAQKAPEIEMIFIDDGSKDDTGAMLDRFAEAEPRARVVHVKNGGVSSARNKGLSLARGRYIAFMDADDALEENGLFLLYQHALHTGAQIVSANHTIFDMKTSERIPVEDVATAGQPAQIVGEIIHMHRIYNNIWNKLYDSALFDESMRLDESVKIGEDALLNLRLYHRARRVQHLAQRTYVYRVHDASAMANIRGYSQAHQPMLQGMNRILLELGVNEQYFRDYLQSCIWIDEKETGIMACMRRFNREIRPLAMDHVDARRILQGDERLYRLVKAGAFPAFYIMARIREKMTGRRWGIRR